MSSSDFRTDCLLWNFTTDVACMLHAYDFRERVGEGYYKITIIYDTTIVYVFAILMLLINHGLVIPYAPCMVYVPTFGIFCYGACW